MASQGSGRGDIERDIGIIRKELLQQSGFTRLARPGQHDNRKTLCQVFDFLCDVSLNPHVLTILKSDFRIVNTCPHHPPKAPASFWSSSSSAFDTRLPSPRKPPAASATARARPRTLSRRLWRSVGDSTA